MKKGNGKKQPYKRRIICTAVSPDEFTKIEEKWKGSTCPNRSNYMRKMLLQKPIVAAYRNRSLDDFMEEMVQLRKELINIEKDFELPLKKCAVSLRSGEFRDWLIAYDLERKILFNKVEEIKLHIQKIAEKWLQ